MKLKEAFDILECIPGPYWFNPDSKMKRAVREPYWSELLEAGLVEQDGAYCYQTAKGARLLSYRRSHNDVRSVPYFELESLELEDALRLMKVFDLMLETQATSYMEGFDMGLEEADLFPEKGEEKVIPVNKIPEDFIKEIKKRHKCRCCKANKMKAKKKKESEKKDEEDDLVPTILKNLREKLKKSSGIRFDLPEGGFGYRIVLEGDE